MVAAGVFLVARVYPLMDRERGRRCAGHSTALQVVTWVGAITAVFAACIAVAQTDIKRILAYSTVSQLGFMMMGLGRGRRGGGDVSFDHARVFQGAAVHGRGFGDSWLPRRAGHSHDGRVAQIHAGDLCDLCGRHDGACRGVPLFFSGFWSKDEILHAAHGWPVRTVPFYLGVFGALLTAFYMTRQVCYVFFGQLPLHSEDTARTATVEHDGASPRTSACELRRPHESPRVMTMPLVILAVFADGAGIYRHAGWPWFQKLS